MTKLPRLNEGFPGARFKATWVYIIPVSLLGGLSASEAHKSAKNSTEEYTLTANWSARPPTRRVQTHKERKWAEVAVHGD